MTEQAARHGLARRRFCRSLALPVAAAILQLPSRAARAAMEERSLHIYHCHTGEMLDTVYYSGGRYLPEALASATEHLRDWRDNTRLPVDPKLLDLLWSLRASLGTSEPIQVFCGYRSPETNAMLRRTHYGVARNSLHMRAMAVDLHFTSRSLPQVWRAAVGLQAGGVGYYPRSGFVHVDTGDVRYW